MKITSNFEKTCISIWGLSKTCQKMSNSKGYFITKKERIINRFIFIPALIGTFVPLLGLMIAQVITHGIFNIPILILVATLSITINIFYKEFKRISLKEFKMKEFDKLEIKEKEKLEFMFMEGTHKD